MKQTSSSGFIVPLIVGILALGATIGVWYSVSQERKEAESLSILEQESAALYIAGQLGISTSKISFVTGNQDFVRFIQNESGQSVFARRSGSAWKIVEPDGLYHSCEQLKRAGFDDDFLYDCQTRYEQISVESLLTDFETESIVVGFLEKISDCNGCVLITNDNQDKITFRLNQDFDDGDYVAIILPDSEIIKINDKINPDYEDPQQELRIISVSDQGDEEEIGFLSPSSSDDSGQGFSPDNQQVLDSSQGESEEGSPRQNQPRDAAVIIEEIIDAAEFPDDENIDEDDVAQSSQENENLTNQSEAVSGLESTNPQSENDPFVDQQAAPGNQDIINFFDLDFSNINVQMIGDPSEDRN